MGPSKDRRGEILDQQRQYRARLARELEEIRRREEEIAKEKAEREGGEK
jgi:hypothetical protein